MRLAGGAGTARGQEDLSAVETNHGTHVVHRTIGLRDEGRGAEYSLTHLRADVGPSGALPMSGRLLEKKRSGVSPSLFSNDFRRNRPRGCGRPVPDSPGAASRSRRGYARARRSRCPSPHASLGTVTVEEHPVSVAREHWTALGERRVDGGPQVDGWSPWRVDVWPLGNPQVQTPRTAARSIALEIEAQPILRLRGSEIVEPRVDDRPRD